MIQSKRKKLLACLIGMSLSGSLIAMAAPLEVDGDKTVADGTRITASNVYDAVGIAGAAESTGTFTIGGGTGTLYIDVASNAAGNSNASGLMIGDDSHVTINGNLNIKAYGGSCFATGLGMNREGAGEGQKADITINGNLTMGDPTLALTDSGDDRNWGVNAKQIHGGYGPDGHVTGWADNYTGARWQPSGVSIGMSGGSFINLNGDVTLAVRGSALKTDPFYKAGAMDPYDLAVINANKGNVTILTPTSTKESFYAAASYGGTININMNGNEAAGHVVDITGNVIAMRDDNGSGQPYFYQDGRINLGLNTADSQWTGVVDNSGKKQAGEVNLWLQNGARWIHDAPSLPNGMQVNNMPSPSNTQYGKYNKVSYINKLTGGSGEGTAGIIHQVYASDISIADYSGNTKIFYQHTLDSNSTRANAALYDNKEVNLTGGKVTIGKAAAGSTITLITDSKGISDYQKGTHQYKNLVNDALNKLANKLYYSAYATAPTNLTAKVEVAEGLTASSRSLALGDVLFSTGSTGTHQAGQGYYEYTVTNTDDPANPALTGTITGLKDRDTAYVDAGILADEGKNYNFTGDAEIKAIPAIDVWSGERNINGVSVQGADHAVNVNAAGHTLTITAKADQSDIVHGIKTSSLKGVNITADKLVIDAKNLVGRVEAINVGEQGGTNKDDPYKLTINGDIDMKVRGKQYALGLYAAGNGDGTFNGNVTALGDATSEWGLTSIDGAWGYYGVSLVYSGSSYSIQMGPKVTINGDVNAKIDGNGLFANGGHAKLTINGGGNIEINKNNTHNYYAMIAESGTTSMNVNLDQNYIATGARDNDLVLKGNIGASTGAINPNESELYTYVNLGLATGKSEWTGVAQNRFKDTGNASGGKTFYGAINLWLQNGATWNHELWGKTAGTFKESHLAKLTGGASADKAGVIYQDSDKQIRVDSYSGHTVVFYEHDEANPQTIDGGDFKIANAAEGSSITLVTDSKGITAGFADSDSATDKNNVSEVLDKLANKLWYTSYTNGHLKGTVKIAEGLTASSAAKKIGGISFSTDSTGTKKAGQGYYNYTPAVDYMSNTIYGLADKDVKYVKEGIRQEDGTYKFTKDYTVSADDRDVTEENLNFDTIIAAVVGDGNDVTLDASGHTLTLKAKSTQDDMDGVGLYANKKADVTAKQLNIEAEADKSDASGLRIYSGGDVTIHGNVSVKVRQTADGKARGIQFYNSGDHDDTSKLTINGSLTMKGDDGGYGVSTARMGKYDDGTYYAATGIYIDDEKGASLTVIGDTDISVKGRGIDIGSLEGKGKNVIDLQGKTTILTPIDLQDKSGSYELINGTKGTLYIGMNAAKDGVSGKDVVLQGRIYYTEGHVHIGLGTENSKLTGTVKKYEDDNGTLSFYLKNGGSWYHQETRGEDVTFKGSHITKLSSDKGMIYQNDANPIQVDNYSGNTTVFYKHDAANPQNIIGGDFKISSAAEGSSITLVTDSKGITAGFADSDSAAARNNVSEVLNKLANKLWYSGYANGRLTGTVKIAEGLTASSATKKMGDISFSTNSTGTNKAGQGYYDYTPAVNFKTGPISSPEDIHVTRAAAADGSVTVTVEDVTVNEGSKYVAALFAGNSSYNKTNPMVVDMNGHDLNLSAQSSNNIAAAAYVTDNTWIRINGSDGKKLSLTANNTDTRAANGILVKGTYANLSVSGPVEIKDIVTKGDSAAGISVQGKNSTVAINGDVTLDTVYGVRGKGLGMNAAGITVIGENSKVNVVGNVAISGVQGSSLRTVGAGTEISVGGGTITAAADADKSHNYYAARVEKGTININMNNDQAGTNTTKIVGDMYVTGQYGKKVVEYSGGELIDWSAAGKLNVALTNGDSSWTGVAAYDQYEDNYGSGGNTVHDVGEFNLYLQNGASWNNEQQSHASTTTISKAVYAGSQLAKLVGGSDAAHAGVIYQNDTNPISVNTYSGNTTVFYKHDETNPQNIIGGDFKITNAAAGSAITLVTDSKGITAGFAASDKAADKNNVSEVLNKLANKLWYSGYADGHLAGTVKIAEGLTASSATKKLGDISFSTDSTGTKQAGQGYYDYTPAVDEPVSDTEFGKAITGVRANDTAYVDAGILVDDGENYNFTKDAEITAGPAIDINGPGHAVNINAEGKTLTINAKDDSAATFFAINTNNSKGTVINAKTLDVTVSGTGRLEGIHTEAGTLTINGDLNLHTEGGSGYIMGIYAARGKQLTINGNVTMKRDSGFELDGGNGYKYYAHSAIYAGNGQKVDVTGDVDFKVNGNGAFANQGGANITLAGGFIEIDKSNTTSGHAALRAESSTVSMNVTKGSDGAATGADTHKVNLLGNVAATSGAVADMEFHKTSVVNLGLSTADSTWTGVAYNSFPDEGINKSWGGTHTGAINIWLQNGATWTNEAYGVTGKVGYGGIAFSGSHLAKLTGGSDAEHAGVIFQNDTNPIRVDNYSGNTTVIYKHEIVDDTTRANAEVYGNKAASVIGGDFKITNAAEGSTITLLTDSAGVDATSTDYKDQNLVYDLMDKLANKLYYSNYADGHLKGVVKIAEGLTSSSMTMKLGDISYYTAADAGKTAGNGYYAYDVVYPSEQVKNPIDKVIDGSADSKDTYRPAGVYHDDADSYDFTGKPADVTASDRNDGVIHASDNDVNVTTTDWLNVTANDGAVGVAAENGKTVTTEGNTKITANEGVGVKADGGVISMTGDTVIQAGTGMEALNGGTITAGGMTNITAEDGNNALHAAGDGSSLTLQKGTINGAILAEDMGAISTNGADLKGTVTAANQGSVSITNGTAQNLVADESSGITVTLNEKGAAIRGDVVNEGNVSVNVSNGATWTGNSTGSGSTSATIGESGTWTGKSDNENTDVDLSGIWVQTGDSKVANLHALNGTLDKSSKDSGSTDIGHASGTLNLIYSHDEQEPTTIYGGDTTIGSADAGTTVNMITDSKGLTASGQGAGLAANKNKVSETLNQLAHKLVYTANDGNITGKLKISEGLTSSSAALRAEDLSFDANGRGFYDYKPEENNLDIEFGSEETQMMRGTKSALLGVVTIWRSNNNDLQRRLGDVRLGQEESGAWARYVGGKNKFDEQNTYISQSYDIGQVGYDKRVGDWIAGVALDYAEGDIGYAGGTGKERMATLALYGTRAFDDGRYLDVIVKTGQLKNKFDVSNEIGNKLNGDYNSWGNSFSVEYGRRFVKDNGFYFDPSVEITAGRVNAKDFTAHSDLGDMNVTQHAFNSAIGRIGLSVGRQKTDAGNAYLKLALAHEFSGRFQTDFFATDGGRKSTKIDLGDTWLDLELGGSFSLGKGTYIYGTYTQTFGAKLETKWRADVGVRYTF
ncbi:MAG: hypothetical protein MR209_02145 [Veillonellaceae bacterium]|nr:hypothetical protein [Veillonellaceae bacterium]